MVRQHREQSTKHGAVGVTARRGDAKVHWEANGDDPKFGIHSQWWPRGKL